MSKLYGLAGVISGLFFFYENCKNSKKFLMIEQK